MIIFKGETIDEYKSIMRAEIELNDSWRHKDKLLSEANDLLNLTIQIMEVAYSSSVIRSYNIIYGLTEEKRTYESDGGHTNLVKEILDRALCFVYGPYSDQKREGYPREDIMRAAGRHDLAENVTGDKADNGDRDEEKKRKIEQFYLKEFSELSPKTMLTSEYNIARILDEFENKSSPIGRLLYLSDKVSAIIATLVEEMVRKPPQAQKVADTLNVPVEKVIGKPPLMSIHSPLASRKDRDLMRIAGSRNNKNVYTAGEMWTVDYLKYRSLRKYDDSGFFTAIVILTTLIVKNEWYDWREEDYKTEKNTILV